MARLTEDQFIRHSFHGDIIKESYQYHLADVLREVSYLRTTSQRALINSWIEQLEKIGEGEPVTIVI